MGNVLLFRRQQVQRACVTLRVLWARTRGFAGVAVPRDVVTLICSQLRHTVDDDVWGVPPLPPLPPPTSSESLSLSAICCLCSANLLLMCS